MNGNIECFTGWHAPLALLAIAVLVITVLLVPVVGLISMKQHLVKVQPLDLCGMQWTMHNVYWLSYISYCIVFTTHFVHRTSTG